MVSPGCCLFIVFKDVFRGLKTALTLKMMTFHTFASFTPCWSIECYIKTITGTVEQAQVLGLWLTPPPRPTFLHLLWVSCRNGAAHEAELHIDLFAVPGKASRLWPRYMIQTSLLLVMVALKAAFVDKSGLRAIRNNCTRTGRSSTGTLCTIWKP